MALLKLFQAYYKAPTEFTLLLRIMQAGPSEVMPSSSIEAANKEVKSIILESSEITQRAQWPRQPDDEKGSMCKFFATS